MWLEDFLNKGKKLFRESTPGVDLKYKANQGYEVTDQSIINGQYTTINGGDEQGWLYCDKNGTARLMGSWSMACPAIYDTSTNSIRPMKDKTQAVDTDYAAKTLSSAAGNSSSTARLAAISGTSIPGVLVACLNHAAQEQVFIPMGGNVTVSYARIAWNFTAVDDMSEGEILSYDPLTNKFTASAMAIWIDSVRSIPNLVFTTAGNKTIFEVQKIGSATRKNVIRDLYIAKKCIEDEGTDISYFRGIRTYADYSNWLDVSLSNGPDVWNNPENSAIFTSILTQTKRNFLCVRIAEDWCGIGNADEFKWARIQSYAPFIAAPIRPILYSREQKLFQDLITYGNNQTISYYRAS